MHWLIYLFCMLDNLVAIIIGALIISTGAFIILGLTIFTEIYNVEYHEIKESSFYKYFQKAFIISIILGVLFCFVPSTKQIIYVYSIPKIVNNKEIQKVLSNIDSEQIQKALNDILQTLEEKFEGKN